MRVSKKTYESSSTYVAIELFKKDSWIDDDYQSSQRVNISPSEFDRLIEPIQRIRSLIDSKDTEVPLAEPPKASSKAFRRKEVAKGRCSQQIHSTIGIRNRSQPLSNLKKNLAQEKNLAFKIEKCNGWSNVRTFSRLFLTISKMFSLSFFHL